MYSLVMVILVNALNSQFINHKQNNMKNYNGPWEEFDLYEEDEIIPFVLLDGE